MVRRVSTVAHQMFYKLVTYLFLPQLNKAPERDKAKLWYPPAHNKANGTPNNDDTCSGW